MSKNEPATKGDVEEVVNRVVKDIVGEVAGEILNVMAERFEKVDSRFDHLEGRMNRMENMLRPTIDMVDEHEAIIRRWKAKTA